jgi:DNA-directed RNA polymerase II subunit RPB1
MINSDLLKQIVKDYNNKIFKPFIRSKHQKARDNHEVLINSKNSQDDLGKIGELSNGNFGDSHNNSDNRDNSDNSQNLDKKITIRQQHIDEIFDRITYPNRDRIKMDKIKTIITNSRGNSGKISPDLVKWSDLDTDEAVIVSDRMKVEDMLLGKGIYKDKLGKLLDLTISRYEKSLIQPAEMVGMNAALAIGEPTTQMLLSSIHTAGSLYSKKSTGLKRLRELTSLLNKGVQKSATVFFQQKQRKVDIPLIKSLLKRCLLKDLRPTIEIELDIATEAGPCRLDEKWEEVFFIFHSKEEYKMAIKFEFKTSIIIERMVDLAILRKLIEERTTEIMLKDGCNINHMTSSFSPLLGSGCFVNLYLDFSAAGYSGHNTELNPDDLYSVSVAGELSARDITYIPLRDDSGKIVDQVDGEYLYIKNILIPKIRKLHVGGIENVTDVYFPESATKQGKEFDRVETDGCNYREILAIPGVDHTKTVSSNPWDIWEVLGIEATRSFLFIELKEVITSDGTYINSKHIDLCVDAMTHIGRPTPATRFGIRPQDVGPLAKVCFEESVNNLTTAGSFAQLENMKGVSSNILMGKRSHAGSGLCEVLYKFDYDITSDSNGPELGSYLPGVDSDILERRITDNKAAIHESRYDKITIDGAEIDVL